MNENMEVQLFQICVTFLFFFRSTKLLRVKVIFHARACLRVIETNNDPVFVS